MNSKANVCFAALLLSGSLGAASVAGAQAPAGSPVPDAPPPPPATTQSAAPIERHSPTAPVAPGGPGAPRGIARGMYRPPMAMAGRGFHDDTRMEMHGAMGSAFRIVPPGLWWRDTNVVQRLSLTADQTKKMDGIFQQSRLQLIDLRANIERQNAILDPMLTANPIEQVKALAQIDKVAQARAELEKADAKMLLGIRAVLTPDQWTKLQNRGDQNRGDRGGRGIAPLTGPGGPQGGAGRAPRPGGAPGGPADVVGSRPEF